MRVQKVKVEISQTERQIQACSADSRHRLLLGIGEVLGVFVR